MKVTQLIDTKPKKILWAAGIVLILLAVFLMGEPTIGPGDTVVINYTISINGVIVDTSIEELAQKANVFDQERTYEPLVIVIGGEPTENAVAPLAVERELLGMRVGEEKSIRMYPLQAYGYIDEEKKVPMPLEEFIQQSGQEPVAGQTYQWGIVTFTVYEVTEDTVLLDFNHRFAVIANEVVISRAEFERSAEAYVGNQVMYQGDFAIVMKVTDTEVTLDVNPAVFEFKVEIIQIKKA